MLENIVTEVEYDGPDNDPVLLCLKAVLPYLWFQLRGLRNTLLNQLFLSLQRVGSSHHLTLELLQRRNFPYPFSKNLGYFIRIFLAAKHLAVALPHHLHTLTRLRQLQLLAHLLIHHRHLRRPSSITHYIPKHVPTKLTNL